MKAIIPAAGIGERLRPFTLTRPKVLLPVAGKPILGHILDRIIGAGIREVVIIHGYLGEQVIQYAQRNYDLDFQFVEQTVRQGLGHAVGLGLSASSEPVLIILGDTILDLDFQAFAQEAANLIGVMEVEDPRRFGIVEVDADNRIRRLIEKPDKPTSRLAIAGIYLIQRENELKEAVATIVRQNIRTRGEYQLTDALQVMLTGGAEMRTAPIHACLDCGTRQTLLETNRYLLTRSANPCPSIPGSLIIPPVSIHPTARIENSIIGPFVSIAEEVIMTDVSLRDSIIYAGSRLTGVSAAHSIIGADCEWQQTWPEVDLGDHSRYLLS